TCQEQDEASDLASFSHSAQRNDFGQCVSLCQSSSMAPRYSSMRDPRPLQGTPSVRYSSSCQPKPTVTAARPPLSQSSVQMALAITMGLCSGKSVSIDPSLIRSVAPAITACGVHRRNDCPRYRHAAYP